MYDLALSFAGENREFVEKIKSKLQQQGISLFYDNDFQVALWGSDLTIELPKHYLNARYVCIFIDKFYLEKMWTFFERQVIIENYLKLKGADYILPIFLNGFNETLPGLSSLVVHLDIDTNKDEDFLTKMLFEKIKN